MSSLKCGVCGHTEWSEADECFDCGASKSKAIVLRDQPFRSENIEISPEEEAQPRTRPRSVVGQSVLASALVAWGLYSWSQPDSTDLVSLTTGSKGALARSDESNIVPGPDPTLPNIPDDIDDTPQPTPPTTSPAPVADATDDTDRIRDTILDAVDSISQVRLAERNARDEIQRVLYPSYSVALERESPLAQEFKRAIDAARESIARYQEREVDAFVILARQYRRRPSSYDVVLGEMIAEPDIQSSRPRVALLKAMAGALQSLPDDPSLDPNHLRALGNGDALNSE